MRLMRLFIEHPASVGETYLQHLRSAAGFSSRMLAGGCACFVHSLLPFLFVHTGSRCVDELYARMVTHRSRVATGQPTPDRADAP